jgi:hypothetical protein
MAYAMARIAMDGDNDTDLSALSFIFVNPNFLYGTRRENMFPCAPTSR